MLEIDLKQSGTRWEWQVRDRSGAILMGGTENTRLEARYRCYGALFLLLARGWKSKNAPRTKGH